MLATRLNRLESIYEIRSSNILFFFELYSVLASIVTLYSLHHNDEVNDDNSLRYLHAYFYAILVVFVFEALPRGWTRVQRQSDANQHDKANFFSRVTFHYMQSIVSLGYKRPLTIDDIKILPKESETQHGYERLNAQWEDHKKDVQAHNNKADADHQKSHSLMRVIGKAFAGPFAIMIFMRVLASMLQFLLPVLFQQILVYIESYESVDELPKARGVILSLGMLTVSLTVSSLTNLFFKMEAELGLEVRNALVSMIDLNRWSIEVNCLLENVVPKSWCPVRPKRAVLSRPSPATTMALPLRFSKREVVGFPLAESTERVTIAPLGSLVGKTTAPIPKVE